MEDYSLIGIVKVLHKWRRQIVYTCATAGVISVIIALILPVYFSSTTTFYAASEDLFKPQKVYGYGDGELNYYGTSSDIQRILTVATSKELVDHIVKEYNLYEHYNIDPEKSKAPYLVREQFLDHMTLIRTKYDALDLTVEDRDPNMAAELANATRDQIDTIVTEIIRGSQRKVLESYVRTIRQKESALDKIQDSLNRTQLEYGIFDTDAQMEYLSKLITSTETNLVAERSRLKSYENSSRRGAQDSVAKIKANVAGLESQLNLLTGIDTTSSSNYNIERFSTAKGKVDVLNDLYQKAFSTVNFDKELLKRVESAFNLDVPAVHVVEVAQVPVVKSRPRRSLIVVGSVLATFVLIVIGVLFIESYKHLDWRFLREW